MTVKSLLPAHFSELEHALDRVGGERLASFSAPVEQLWNAWTCPAEYLPVLAWSLSVDIWNTDWPENIKRQVIHQTPELHRIKGTDAAILKALEAVDIVANYKSWYQQSPEGKRGTFEVLAYTEQNVDESGGTRLTHENIKEAERLISIVKRGSQHHEFKIASNFESNLVLSGVLSLSFSTSLFNQTIPAPDFQEYQ